MELKKWLKEKIQEGKKQKRSAVKMQWYQGVVTYESVIHFLEKELEILEQDEAN